MTRRVAAGTLRAVLARGSKTIEQHAAVIVSLLAVVTAALGVLSAYLEAERSDAVQRQEEAQGQSSDLASELASLRRQNGALKQENAELRARLETGPGETDGGGGSTTPDTRTLKVPLPDDGIEGIFLDKGEARSGGAADFSYGRQESTGKPELTSDWGTPYSTDVKSAVVGKDECSEAVTRSPTVAPVRDLETGTLICANTDGGTSLLEVLAQPSRSGTLRLRQTFWAK